MADDQAFGNVTVRWSDIWEDPTDLIFPETSPTAWSAGRLWSSAIALVITVIFAASAVATSLGSWQFLLLKGITGLDSG
jgi:hypothetical protein